MEDFSQVQASGPQGLRPGGEIKGLRGGVLQYVAQVIPQIDAEIAEKGHFWMETSYSIFKKEQWDGEFWTDEYHITAVGVRANRDTVKKYVQKPDNPKSDLIQLKLFD